MARAFASFSTIHYKRKKYCVRADTRLYLGDQSLGIEPTFGKCIGFFYLQNPGSALSLMPLNSDGGQDWGPLCYKNENLMPQLEKVLTEALGRLREADELKKAKQFEKNAFVRILNLSGIQKSKDTKGETIDIWDKITAKDTSRNEEISDNMAKSAKFLVFGWGSKFLVNRDSTRVTKSLNSFVNKRMSFIWPVAKEIEAGEKINVHQHSTNGIDHADFEAYRKLQKAKPTYPAPYNKPRKWHERYAVSVGKAISTALIA